MGMFLGLDMMGTGYYWALLGAGHRAIFCTQILKKAQTPLILIWTVMERCINTLKCKIKASHDLCTEDRAPGTTGCC